jgi:small subunit ribosomal protein S18
MSDHDNQNLGETASELRRGPSFHERYGDRRGSPPVSDTSDDGNPGEYQPSYESRSRRAGVEARLEDVHFKNVSLLSRFIDQRGRILSRHKTRVSAHVQRAAVRAIKQARHLALLPYTADQTRIVRKRR